MSDLLEYKGYQGSVEFSAEDRCLFGKVLHIADHLYYDAASVDELEKAFKETVEEYLALCQERGTEPNKPFKGVFQVRVEPDLHRAAAMTAAREKLTLNEFVRNAIHAAVAPQKSPVQVMQAKHAMTAIQIQMTREFETFKAEFSSPMNPAFVVLPQMQPQIFSSAQFQSLEVIQ